jgi:hypothetical protein
MARPSRTPSRASSAPGVNNVKPRSEPRPAVAVMCSTRHGIPCAWKIARSRRRSSTVSDAQGNVIRRLTGPTTAGIQRVSWDLRHPPPTPPRAGAPADYEEGGGGRGGGAGPVVTPGTYTVSLAKRVDGVTTSLGAGQKFDVYLLDESLPTRPAAVVALQQQVTKLQRAMIGANSLVDELTTRTQALLRATEETPGAPAKLATDIRSIEKELRDTRETLNGDPTMSRRQEASPPSLMGRLNTLAQGARSIDAPTATQQHQYDIVAGEYSKIQSRLRAIVDTELKRIESAAEQAGVPWTSGRIPEWRP